MPSSTVSRNALKSRSSASTHLRVQCKRKCSVRTGLSLHILANSVGCHQPAEQESPHAWKAASCIQGARGCGRHLSNPDTISGITRRTFIIALCQKALHGAFCVMLLRSSLQLLTCMIILHYGVNDAQLFRVFRQALCWHR